MSQTRPRTDTFHAVIMAGGSGTRFWPASRRRLPKQFLPLGGTKTLLRQTFERLTTLASPSRIWVVTNSDYVDLVLQELPELSPERVIGEPAARNTAPCIGLAARRIASEAGGESLLVCPADHVIAPPEVFEADVVMALQLLAQHDTPDDPLSITFGIEPRYPATGFGYIERGEAMPLEGDGISSEGPGAPARSFLVDCFREKPELAVAEEYVSSGRFYWNSGIFVWSTAGIQKLIATHLPELATGLDELERRAGEGGGFPAALESCFGELPSISIDYGVLERAGRVAVVASRFEWDDVGSWAALERYAEPDGAGNGVIGQHVGLNTRNCIVVGKDRLIATIGVEDLVIVETDDAVLVCRRDQTEKVKELVGALKASGREELI